MNGSIDLIWYSLSRVSSVAKSQIRVCWAFATFAGRLMGVDGFSQIQNLLNFDASCVRRQFTIGAAYIAKTFADLNPQFRYLLLAHGGELLHARDGKLLEGTGLRERKLLKNVLDPQPLSTLDDVFMLELNPLAVHLRPYGWQFTAFDILVGKLKSKF